MARPGGPSDEEDVRLQRALDATRPELQNAATTEHAKAWLRPCLRTQEGTRQLYALLQQYVSREAFLQQIERARAQLGGTAAAGPPAGQAEVLRPNGGWWQVPAEELTANESASLELVEPDGLPVPDGNDAVQSEGDIGFDDGDEGSEALDSYVVVEQADVLEAIGQFVAAYLATMPDAANLQPKQLQKALTQTFKELRKGRVRQLWDWGKGLYRVGAVTYSAFSLYTNPWLVRAVLAAVWTASKVMTGLIF